MSSDTNGIHEKPPQLASRPKPRCALEGTTGNAMLLAEAVLRALMDAGQEGAAVEFANRALLRPFYESFLRKTFRAGFYDEVLTICRDYVEPY